ncbi:hypothetical protein ACLB2K_051102 [Fragaria x ananassa]
MNFISWNCQGLGKFLTIQTLKEITRSHDLSFVFLSETHKNDNYVNKVRRQLGFSKGYHVSPINTAGGLSLWWRPNYKVEVVDYSKIFIDTLITYPGSATPFRVTWMYGPPYGEDKAAFWKKWYNSNHNVSIPWLIIGDLNKIINSFEREGGSCWLPGRRNYPRNFISSNSLLDIGYKGSCFTWARKEDGIVVLQERLDRSLLNECWIMH